MRPPSFVWVLCGLAWIVVSGAGDSGSGNPGNPENTERRGSEQDSKGFEQPQLRPQYQYQYQYQYRPNQMPVTQRPRTVTHRSSYSLMADAVDSRESSSSSGGSSCADNDLECLGKNLSESDRLGLEAIQLLHGQLDDDDNGNVDLSESDDLPDLMSF